MELLIEELRIINEQLREIRKSGMVMVNNDGTTKDLVYDEPKNEKIHEIPKSITMDQMKNIPIAEICYSLPTAPIHEPSAPPLIYHSTSL